MKISTLKSILYSRKILHLAVGVAALLSTTSLEATLIHQYELNGNYLDTFSGPSLDPGGPLGTGTLNATNYSFDANQGLSLSSALSSAGTYSILVDFSISVTNSYRKLIDFKNFNSTSGDGLYNVTSALQLYGSPAGGAESPSGVFQVDTLTRMVITRDAGQNFRGYVNGMQVGDTYLDTPGLGVFSGSNNIIQFFNSNVGDASESSGGLVDRIQIYDTALTAAEVLALGAANVPEPSALMLASLGLTALVGIRKRNHSK